MKVEHEYLICTSLTSVYVCVDRMCYIIMCIDAMLCVCNKCVATVAVCVCALQLVYQLLVWFFTFYLVSVIQYMLVIF